MEKKCNYCALFLSYTFAKEQAYLSTKMSSLPLLLYPRLQIIIYLSVASRIGNNRATQVSIINFHRVKVSDSIFRECLPSGPVNYTR